MLQESTIPVPTSAAVWALGIIASAFLSGISFCGHLLISMNKKMSTMSLWCERTDGRVATLERHDNRNQAQSDLMLHKILESK